MITFNELIMHLSNNVNKCKSVEERIDALRNIKKEIELFRSIGDIVEFRYIEELLAFAYETGKLEQLAIDNGEI